MDRDGATLALKTRGKDILDVCAHFSGQHDGRSDPFRFHRRPRVPLLRVLPAF